MILLSFRVRNHRSIRDEVTFNLARPTLRTLQPKDGDWGSATYRLAGIFGGNATGKSAVLDAILYAFAAVRQSATEWQGSRGMRRSPFRLDDESRHASSLYELEFVHGGRRHRYGFEVDASGVSREWLRDIPTSRWRTLLERDRSSLEMHPSVRTAVEVTGRELVLSRAALLERSPLHSIAVDLIEHFDIVLVKDSHREARLMAIADSLAEGSITFDDLALLLQVADIGVAAVSIEERDIPERLRQALLRFSRDIRDEETAAGEPSSPAGTDGLEGDALLEQIARRLLFTHRGTANECPQFSIQDESDGTIAWLATAVPALEVLRSGGLLVVDEIDASLHPHLLELLLGAFSDPDTNTRNAQLVFASHESYVLSPLSEVRLDPEQVWFTDKSYEGVTELTCLADFPRHPDANVAKRYLTGRYGGTPRLSPSTFAALAAAREG